MKTTTSVAAAIPAIGCWRMPPREARLYQRDLWHYTIGKVMADASRARTASSVLVPLRFADPLACEAQFRNAFIMGCAGLVAASAQIDIAKRVFSPDRRGRSRDGDPQGDAGWDRRGRSTRQDADDATRKQAKVIDLPFWSPPRTPQSGGVWPLTPNPGARRRLVYFPSWQKRVSPNFRSARSFATGSIRFVA
jgi:hypothetical protein